MQPRVHRKKNFRFRRGLYRGGCCKSQYLVFFPTNEAVIAAKAAGMYAVAVTTSFPRNELKAAGADTVTDDLCDLLSVLGPGRPIRA